MNNATAISMEHNVHPETERVIPILSIAMFGEHVQVVDARDLYRFLEVDARFNDWIARRIAEYQFQEGTDFCSFLSKSTGGRPGRQYHITLDMGKELAMVERNEKGRQARQYFIACEKRLLQMAPDEARTIAGRTIGTDGFHCLAAVMDGKLRKLKGGVKRAAKNHIWQQVHRAFSVVRAEDIPAGQLDAARNFIAAYALDGEWLPKEDLMSTASSADWSNIACLINCIERSWEVMDRYQLSHHLNSLGCKAGLEIASFLWDGLGSAAHVKKHCAIDLALAG